MPKLLDRLMHRRDHRCRKRFRHVADAAANDTLCYTGVRVTEGFDPPRNLGKQVASLELQIIFVEVRHDNRKKNGGTRSVASSEHGTTRRASLQIGCAALVVLRDCVPVDHVPPGLDVISSAVLVKEVISVLPDVESEHRFVALHQWAVLARSGHNYEFS